MLDKKIIIGAFIAITIASLIFSFPYLSKLFLPTEVKVIYIKESNLKEKTLQVHGMTCLGCELTLEKSISQIEGIAKVKASYSDDTVFIKYDKTKTNNKNVIKAIQDAGYKVKE